MYCLVPPSMRPRRMLPIPTPTNHLAKQLQCMGSTSRVSWYREVDEALIGEHYGADGFVEQIEGWAFMMAVLPRIDDCSASVAETVLSNVQVRQNESDPRTTNSSMPLNYRCLVCYCTLELDLSCACESTLCHISRRYGCRRFPGCHRRCRRDVFVHGGSLQ